MPKLYESKLSKREREYVIDSSNFADFIPRRDSNPKGFYKPPKDIVRAGALPPPDGYSDGIEVLSHPAGDAPIPMSEWPDRIEAMERNKTRASDIAKQKKLKCGYQNGTLFCWKYGTVKAYEIARAVAGKPTIHFSPCAGAHVINNGRNHGGFCERAIRFMAERGVATMEDWPNLKYGRSGNRYDTDETWANAAQYKPDKWEIGPVKTRSNTLETAQLQASAWLRRQATAQHYNWWRHIVCGVDLVMKASRDANDINRYGVRIWNSWGTGYGDQGWAIIWFRKGIADRWCTVKVD